jgi:DNA-binding NtrC family response regulator
VQPGDPGAKQRFSYESAFGVASTETFDDNARPADCRPSHDEPQLFVVLECDRPSEGGARYSLAGVNEVRIGRGERREAARVTDHGYTTLHLRLPGRSLSSAHARLVRCEGKWLVEDAPSKNGTFVNGSRVDRAPVGASDLLEVGHTLLVIRESVEMRGMPSDLDSHALAAEPVGMRTLVPRLAESFLALKRVADSNVPLLLLGDTGTGKEVVASAVHALSGRSGTFVAANCGALSPTLFDAQLFGHTRGAFSGASRDEPGIVRSAHGGTLFLDEIGELPRPSQTALLRVIQESEVVPVGSAKPVRVDLRVVSATLKSIRLSDSFRSDLYARLAGHTLHLPPLADRLEDLGLLVADILRAIAGDRAPEIRIATELGRLLATYRWPLNIRELKQGLQTGLVLSPEGPLEPRHFPQIERASGSAGPNEAPPPDLGRGLSDEEARLRITLIARLREHRGNVSAVARAMGKATMQVHRWMRRFEIDPNDFRRG